MREPFFFSEKALLAARSQMSPKLLLHGEPQEGKPFDIECIYQFIFAEHYGIKALVDFVDSKALASMG